MDWQRLHIEETYI